MTKQEILKDNTFEAITDARMDSKHRVALGQAVPGPVTSFKVYRNTHGQIILDPMVSVPAHEAWLFKNKQASRLVREGLEDAKRGRLVKSKEDFSKHIKSDD